MSDPVVLLVENDATSQHHIRTALERRLLPRPRQVTTGEEAVLWIGANSCDMCLLAYDLPGIDGLEAFLRIKQRRPSVPVVMLSAVESEDIAIKAFRAGVMDYVPKKPGFPDTVADLVQKTLRQSVYAPVSSSTSGADIAEQLLQSTYQNKLRTIGRQLDLYHYRSINLIEVGEGFLVRTTSPGGRAPEALEFLNKDFIHLLRAGIAARGEGERARAKTKLLPTGYEDFLRALGHHLDEHFAEAISVVELEDFIAVGGLGRQDIGGQTVVGPLQLLLYSENIDFLLDEAYRRRAPEPERKDSRLGRMFGRRNE